MEFNKEQLQVLAKVFALSREALGFAEKIGMEVDEARLEQSRLQKLVIEALKKADAPKA